MKKPRMSPALLGLIVAGLIAVGGYLLFQPQECVAKTDSEAIDLRLEDIYMDCSTPIGVTLRLPYVGGEDGSWTYATKDEGNATTPNRTTPPNRTAVASMTGLLGVVSGGAVFLVLWLRRGGVDRLLAGSDPGYERIDE